jgi:hypothetical protein
MTDRLADGDLRLLAPRANAEGFGDHDSLQNVITDELPNGALCWVNSTEGLYRLDKLDNSSAAVLGVVIIPLGGPGRWILLASGSSQAQLSAEVFLIATNFAGPSLAVAAPSPAETWVAGPTSQPPTVIYAGVFAPVFSLDQFQGTLTYLGPTRRYLLQSYVSMELNTSSLFQLGLTSDLFTGGVHDRLFTTNNDGTEAVETNIAPFQSLAAARSVILTAGDVVRPVITNSDLGLEPVSESMVVTRLHLVATPFE